MKKGYQNKEVRTNTDAPDEIATPAAPALPRKLICVRECVMPGVGAFAHGQTIDDPIAIEKIGDNPNFQTLEEAN